MRNHRSHRVSRVEGKQVRALRARAHRLRPVVSIGSAGASEPVLAELEIALDHHELVKLKIRSEERSERDAIIAAVCAQTGAELIQRVGHVAVLYRKRDS